MTSRTLIDGKGHTLRVYPCDPGRVFLVARRGGIWIVFGPFDPADLIADIREAAGETAQEPTDAEVDAAADVLEIIDGMDFQEVARAALSAARAARRDEETR